jgi:hypothetical protein
VIGLKSLTDSGQATFGIRVMCPILILSIPIIEIKAKLINIMLNDVPT